MSMCMRRHGRVGVLLITLLGSCLGAFVQSEARDLTDEFIRGFSFATSDSESALGVFNKDGSLDPSGEPLQAAARAVAPAVAAAISQAVTQEFPLASVAPAFTYRYNPTLSIFERSSGVPGPLFSERALALGKGQLNFSVGYSYVDFSNLNGTDLHHLDSPAHLLEIFNPNENFVFPLSLTTLRTKLDLKAHVIVPAARYGITENWDVSLAIPIVNTFMRVRNESVRAVDLAGGLSSDAKGNLLFVDRNGKATPLNDARILPFVRSTRPIKTLSKAAGSATGVGDISLRTKYRFWETEGGGAALGLNFLFPSGEVRDFQGSDETHVSTLLYLSRVLWDRFEPHLNLGLDFNANDVDRSSFLYAAGASFLVWRQLGLVVDFIGRDEFGRFPVNVPAGQIVGANLDRPASACTTANPCHLTGTKQFLAIPITFKRNDLADFSFGLRYALGTQGSIFFGGIIPLNDDGLRADFIPSGGVEYTF